MKIVMRNYGQGSGFGDAMFGECEYSVLDVTPEFLGLVRDRIKLVATAYEADNQVTHLSFWESSLTQYGYELFEALEMFHPEIAGEVEDDNWSVLPEGFDLGKYQAQRTECDQLEVNRPFDDVCAAGFNWRFAPKHCDFYVTTPELNVPEIVEALSMEGIIA